MSRTVRVIVLNTDEEVAADLRTVLLSVEGVKIVAEIDEPAMLTQAIEHFPAEVLLIHLDPNAAAIMDVVAPLVEARKEQIAAIAMTEDRDAELVRRAMRAGMRELLWKPFPPEQLAEILQRLGAETRPEGARLGKLVTVVGTGGGHGATQLTTNLAVELANLDTANGSGKPRVATVDLDFRFGQVAMQLDAAPTYTVADLCESLERVEPQMLERVVFKHQTGVHVLARPAELDQAERISAAHCAAILSSLQEQYDFVVIDLPARFDPTARVVLDAADYFLLVTQLQVPSVRCADRILKQLTNSGYPMQRVRLVCNRFGRDSGYLEQADVEQTLHRKFDALIPDDWKTSSTAVNMGAPLFTLAPKSRLRQAYQRLAQQVAGVIDSPEADAAQSSEPARKSLLKFLVGAK